jgi:hypothetical protein
LAETKLQSRLLAGNDLVAIDRSLTFVVMDA